MSDFTQLVDVIQLRRNTVGDPELLSELVSVFEEDLPSIETELELALARTEGAEVAKAAHKLKGALLVFGARCAATALEIELRAPAKFDDGVRALVSDLRHEIRLLVPALRSLEPEEFQ